MQTADESSAKTSTQSHGETGDKRSHAGFRLSADDFPLLVGNYLVGNLVAFPPMTHTAALNGGDMEHVLAAIVGLNKPKPFVALNHFTVPMAICLSPIGDAM
jgi:hypothetical protein